MICAYCGQEAKGTKEHIISCAILDIFPECFATIDNLRGKIHLGDPMVKDVCANCNNNRISYIDSYAKSIVSDYFVQKYEKNDVLDFSYDYTLLQKMLLKYAFNDLRSQQRHNCCKQTQQTLLAFDIIAESCYNSAIKR